MAAKKTNLLNIVALSTAGLFLLSALAGTTAQAMKDNENVGPTIEELQTEPAEATDSESPEPSETTPEEPTEDSDSAHVEKEADEPAVITDEEGKTELFTLTVETVQHAQTCPARVGGQTLTPENGQFLILDATATMKPLSAWPENTNAEEAFVPVLADTFKVTLADGQELSDVQSESSWGCFQDTELLPSFISAGETKSGKIVLDVPAGATSVIYDPLNSGGWSWELN
ncbi:hypothetical protein [Micrococcoides hystricis]|uniref:DUF4352 domain-containing protein n=1 Tax=Micrococcoides hystricis TaxID=1572761 RepID=A0ABV6P895_9MICC